MPKVLVSGNHAEIDKWRRLKSIIRTAKRRPDLLEKETLSKLEQDILTRFKNDKLTESEKDFLEGKVPCLIKQPKKR